MRGCSTFLLAAGAFLASFAEGRCNVRPSAELVSTVALSGLLSYCALDAADDLGLAELQSQGFYPFKSMTAWPGHDYRDEVHSAALRCPRSFQQKVLQLIRKHRLSSADMYAVLLATYGSRAKVTETLRPWQRLLARAGLFPWDLRWTFEELYDVGLSYRHWLRKDNQTIEALFSRSPSELYASARTQFCPWFDHIAGINAVFHPFLPPRSGFGLALVQGHAVVAVGPGLGFRDHEMTLWHEMLHYPIQRVMALPKHNSTLTRALSTSKFWPTCVPTSRGMKNRQQLVEENLVAQLTDRTSPSVEPRPAMLWDSAIGTIIDEQLSRDGHINLDLLIGECLDSICQCNG